MKNPTRLIDITPKTEIDKRIDKAIKNDGRVGLGRLIIKIYYEGLAEFAEQASKDFTYY